MFDSNFQFYPIPNKCIEHNMIDHFQWQIVDVTVWKNKSDRLQTLDLPINR